MARKKLDKKVEEFDDREDEMGDDSDEWDTD